MVFRETKDAPTFFGIARCGENQMKTVLKLVIFTVGACLAYSGDPALAQPGYGGSGCPGGSASVSLSPDHTTLRVGFNRYRVVARGAVLDRKSCSLAVPIDVPRGRSVSILSVDYRGYTRLPRGASSQFNVEYFFAGRRGASFGRTFPGPSDNAYGFSTAGLGWSGCGAGVTLRSNSSIRVSTNANAQEARAASAEHVQQSATYHLRWRSCR